MILVNPALSVKVNPTLGATLKLSPGAKIYCLGDSLSNGTYNQALRTLLGRGYMVVEVGTGSNTVVQMLARLDADVINTPADCVVVWGGVNDIAGDATAVAIEGNLQSIYTACHTAGLVVVAINITPFKGDGTWTADRQVVLETVNTWIGATAANVEYVVDMYALLEDPGEADTLLAAYDSGDHIHLSTAGYNLVASTLYSQVTWR